MLCGDGAIDFGAGGGEFGGFEEGGEFFFGFGAAEVEVGFVDPGLGAVGGYLGELGPIGFGGGEIELGLGFAGAEVVELRVGGGLLDLLGEGGAGFLGGLAPGEGIGAEGDGGVEDLLEFGADFDGRDPAG